MSGAADQAHMGAVAPAPTAAEAELAVQARQAPERSRGYWAGVWRRLRRDPVTIACALVLLLMLLAIAFAPLLAPHDPYQGSMIRRLRPIGTGFGLKTRDHVQLIIENATVPVVVDAGLGLPSHAAECMEIGADAVLVNTALAIAEDPVKMATAFKLGVAAGRLARLSGPGATSEEARPSSPLTGWT